MSITETTTTVANKQTDNRQTFIKYSSRNHGYCMAIMQVVVVACLGVTETPGRSVVKSRNKMPDVLLSRRGLIRSKGKWSFSLWDHLVKMLPTERS